MSWETPFVNSGQAAAPASARKASDGFAFLRPAHPPSRTETCCSERFTMQSRHGPGLIDPWPGSRGYPTTNKGLRRTVFKDTSGIRSTPCRSLVPLPEHPVVLRLPPTRTKPGERTIGSPAEVTFARVRIAMPERQVGDLVAACAFRCSERTRSRDARRQWCKPEAAGAMVSEWASDGFRRQSCRYCRFGVRRGKGRRMMACRQPGRSHTAR